MYHIIVKNNHHIDLFLLIIKMCVFLVDRGYIINNQLELYVTYDANPGGLSNFLLTMFITSVSEYLMGTTVGFVVTEDV